MRTTSNYTQKLCAGIIAHNFGIISFNLETFFTVLDDLFQYLTSVWRMLCWFAVHYLVRERCDVDVKISVSS